MGRKQFFLILSLMVCCCIEGMSWWDLGHFVTAQIAEKKIHENSKSEKVQAEIEKLLKVNVALPPNPNVSFNDNTLVGAATWMDNINSCKWSDNNDLKKFKTLHYTTFPYEVNEETGSFYDALEYVKKRFAEKKSDDGYDHSAVTAVLVCVKTLMSKRCDKVEKAVALRMLIHLLGDIHCPMHSVEPIVFGNQTHGGNFLRLNENDDYIFKVENGSDNHVNNMHKIWDGLGGVYKNLPWPVKDLNNNHVISVSEDIVNSRKSYPFNQNADIYEWAAETMLEGRLAVNSSNLDYIANQDGNLDYIVVKDKFGFIHNVGKVCKNQLYKGGVRLAGILIAIFAPEYANPAYLKFTRKIMFNPEIPTLQEYLDMIFLESVEENIKEAA